MSSLSIGKKLSCFVLLIMVFVLGVVTIFNYKLTANEIRSLFKTIQQEALVASFTTINITMNIEANQHLKAIVKELEKLDKYNVVGQREVLFKASDLIKYPALYIVYEDDGAVILQDYDENKPNTYLSPNFNNTPGDDWRQRDWYVKTKQKNTGITTSVYTSKSGIHAGKLLSTVTMPLIKNGKFIGVLGVDIFVHDFQKRFENFETHILPSLDIYLTDDTGRIFSHKDPKIVENTNLYPQEIKLLEELKTKKEGEFIYIDTNGFERLGFYKQFPFGWTVVSAAKIKDYTDKTNLDLFYTVGVSVVMLVIAILLIYYIINKIVGWRLPILVTSLNTLFKFLNHENVTIHPIKIKAKDELGVIGELINENVEKTKKNLDKDTALVQNAFDAIKTAREGNAAKARVTMHGSNPQLNALKEQLNGLLDLLVSAVGSDLNELNRVFDSFMRLDFSTKIEDAKGRVEITTNT
ncbi:methyl-accepting chemotaxis protein, partial [Campylobacter sp. LR185c]